jgi:hypothetical protein
MPAPSAPASESMDAQIEKTEHKIDELLSESLIHPEELASHQEIPKPVESPHAEIQPGQAPASKPVVEGPASTVPVAGEHHGLKVIEPLEPIVPAKEKFAKELQALEQPSTQVPIVEAAQVQGEAKEHSFKIPFLGKHDKPEQAEQPRAAPGASQPQNSVNPQVLVAAPTPPPATQNPSAEQPKEPPQEMPKAEPAAIIKHPGEALPETAPLAAGEQVVAEDDDSVLPEAESLAADDVARARAKQSAAAQMKKEEPAKDAPVTTPAPPVVKKPPEAPNQPKPEPIRSHGKAPKPMEQVASKEEAEHNKPNEAQKEQGALTGKLIMPTGDKPKQAPVLAVEPEKPKKLAPGEVYVDSKGNVTIGE